MESESSMKMEDVGEVGEHMKFSSEPRLATRRELHLLANVFAGRNQQATQNQKRLGSWSEGQLFKSLDQPKEKVA